MCGVSDNLMEVLEFHTIRKGAGTLLSDAAVCSVCSATSEKLLQIVDGGVGDAVESQVREEIGG